MYADIERVLTGWLEIHFPTARVCSELPDTLPPRTIQVVRIGGARREIPFDDATVDVDCYASSRVEARTLAEQVSHALMYSLPGYRVDNAMVVSAGCFSAPSWAPHDNPSVRRVTAAYQIRTHNPI